jgi:protein TIF31
MLNCLLGSRLTPEPVAETDDSFKALYSNVELSYESLTPESLRAELVDQVRIRFRYDIQGELVSSGKELQMLREVSLKLGLQLLGRDYIFAKDQLAENRASEVPAIVQILTNGAGKKKKRSNNGASPQRGVSPLPKDNCLSFHPDDIVNFVPVVKEASPKVRL